MVVVTVKNPDSRCATLLPHRQINREGLIIKVKHGNLERLSTAMLVEGPIIKVECCRLLTAQRFVLFQLPILDIFIVSLH